jgi:hypothetical protein
MPVGGRTRLYREAHLAVHRRKKVKRLNNEAYTAAIGTHGQQLTFLQSLSSAANP